MGRSVASTPDAVVGKRRSVISRLKNSAIDPASSFSGEEQSTPLDQLVQRLKSELRAGFVEGRHPSAADYIAHYPELAENRDKVVSLVYEEYCLLEEMDERPDTVEFCERYAPWAHSIQEQLQFHRIFSQVADAASAESTIRDPKPSEYFSSFRLLSEIGQGGAARVYLAADEDLGQREVVLKVSADRGNEASIQGVLNHPNIVPVLSVARSADTHLRGLCMPYRPGLPLDRVIHRLFADGKKPDSALAIWKVLAASNRLLPAYPEGKGWEGFPIRGNYAEGVAWIIEKIALALHHAHVQQIFHRDVKPANILLTHAEGPQLLDFNLAAAPTREEAAVALRGGTLPYMAPEQLRAFRSPECWREVAGASDVYSLGLVARELLSGKAPIDQDPRKPLPQTIIELLEARSSASPWPPLRVSNPKLPHAFDAIIDRCLVADSKLRYPDSEALAEDLRRFRDRLPLKIARNPSPRERGFNWANRNHRALILAIAVLGLTMTTVGAAQLNQWLTPYEKRPEFARLRGKYDERKYDEVRKGLEDLRVRGVQSPIFLIYSAAASNGDVPAEIQDDLAKIWTDRKTIARFSAWSTEDSGFIDVLERLAIKLYDQDGSKDPERNKARDQTAANVATFIYDREPKRDRPRLILAAFNEMRGDYIQADQFTSETIEEKAGSNDPKVKKDALLFYETRGRMTSKWVKRAIEQELVKLDPERFSRLISRSIGDLDRAIDICRVCESAGMMDKFEADKRKSDDSFRLSEAYLVEGDLYGVIKSADDALPAFDQAERVFKNVRPDLIKSEFLKDLERRIRSRLSARNDEPARG